MKKAPKPAPYIAACAAIPIEGVNFLLARFFPIDVGLPPHTPLWFKVIAYQALLLHAPGLMLYVRLYASGAVQPVGLFEFMLLATGYADTFLLILAVVLAIRWVRSRALAAPKKTASF